MTSSAPRRQRPSLVGAGERVPDLGDVQPGEPAAAYAAAGGDQLLVESMSLGARDDEPRVGDDGRLVERAGIGSVAP